MLVVQASMFGARASYHCGICGRALSNPDSVQRGIGPICNGRHRKGGEMKEQEFTDYYIDEPIEEGIVLERTERGVGTNVPHLVVHHSPDGFEFGYGGSGPADLALNIVETILIHTGYSGDKMKCYDGQCFTFAWHLHQEFKRLFIATVDHEAGGTIRYELAAGWIQKQMDA